MVDHVVDNDFADLENIEPAGPSEPESAVSGEESEDLQDQEGSQSAAVQDFNAGKEESPWPELNTFFSAQTQDLVIPAQRIEPGDEYTGATVIEPEKG
ncbi:Hypothetical predicted protein, partial [Paramuricea clavata]